MTLIWDLLCLAGLAALVAAGWICHPALGLAVAGLAAIAVGVGNRFLASKPRR